MSFDFSKMSFLIIDDFEKFRTVVKGVVQLCGGKNIDSANSGSEAISRIKEHAYDVILCDYHLGQGKNGQQILEQLRHENLLKPSAVFLMVTAESGSEMVMSALECQPDGYLMKPFNQAILESRLSKIVRAKQTLSPIHNAMYEKDFDTAIKQCQKIAKDKPKYASQCMRIQTQLLIKQKRYEEAELICKATLKAKSLPWAELCLGEILYHRKDYKSCIQILIGLLKKNKMILQAYDWIAKAQLKLGNPSEAEQTLRRAVELSPAAILRQMHLGQLASKIGNTEVAEQSFRAAVKLGRHSCYKTPDNYINLVRTLRPKLESDNEITRKRATDETFSVISEVKTDYRDNKSVTMEATLLQSQSHQLLEQPDKAKRALDMAAALYETHSHNLSADLKVELARTMSQLGQQERADKIAAQLLTEYADDPDILEQIGQFTESSPLNAEGIALYQKGQFREAISKFEEACKDNPNSISINLNAIQAISRELQENGSDDALVEIGAIHFKRLESLQPDDKRYDRFKELKKFFSSVAKGA